MTFLFVARAVSIICVGLFAILCFVPAIYAPLYGVIADEGVQFITRRAAPMFLAPALILWVAAATPRSALRDAVAIGCAAMFVGIAVTGLVSFAQGIASAPIITAAVLECVIAATLWHARKN